MAAAATYIHLFCKKPSLKKIDPPNQNSPKNKKLKDSPPKKVSKCVRNKTVRIKIDQEDKEL